MCLDLYAKLVTDSWKGTLSGEDFLGFNYATDYAGELVLVGHCLLSTSPLPLYFGRLSAFKSKGLLH